MKREISKDFYDKLSLKISKSNYVCGVDEVGRGPLAGPVVACAVIMPKEKIEGVKDSKKLSEKKRIYLDKVIREKSLAIGFGLESNESIDEINIRKATLKAMKSAVENLSDKNGVKIKPDLILVDNEKIDVDFEQYGIVHGDDVFYEISCASILAKVYRDRLMIEFSKIYPNYGFEKNKGYGTKLHYMGLEEFDACPIHRKSFLKKFYENRR